MKSIFLISLISFLTACGGGGGASDSSATINERSGDNDTNETAQVVSVNSIIIGDLNITEDTIDIFKINVIKQETIIASLTGPSNTDFDLYISDSTGGYIGSSANLDSTEEMELMLAAGSYQIEVETYDGSGDYQLTIEASTVSVRVDEGFACLQFDSIPRDLAAELASDVYEYGSCSNQYAYRCDMDVEGLDGEIYFTSSVTRLDALGLCDDYDGRLTSL
ncbi:MAG: hypothetical protein V7785_13830 [Bermanella sp.]